MPQAPNNVAPRTLSLPVRIYCLFLITCYGTVSLVDRNIMSVLVEPIRRELSLSDTQIGFLTGTAFAVVYSATSIPGARLADRWSRSKMVGLAITFWSVMTMLCGAAAGALPLLLTRLGVGMGEAAGGASSNAFLSDIFPRHQRATAMSILTLCSPIGLGIAYGAGGWLLAHHGWRATFVVVGLPGLLIAALILFTFPFVPKGMVEGFRAEPAPTSFKDTLGFMFAVPSWLYLVLAGALNGLVATGVLSWMPAFLARSHGLSTIQIGKGLGIAVGFGSLTGHLLGGPLFDWLGRRDLRWHFWMPAIVSPAIGIVAWLAIFLPPSLVFPLLTLQLFLIGIFAGPVMAIVFNLTPVNMRATVVACCLIVFTAIGQGLGPQLVGILSDWFKPHFGTESLRHALLCVTFLSLPTGLFYFLGAKTYRTDIAGADAFNRRLEE